MPENTIKCVVPARLLNLCQTSFCFCAIVLAQPAMVVAPEIEKQIDEISAWRNRYGDCPKRSRDNGEETRLAVSLAKLKIRCQRALGTKPSERQLDIEEVDYLNQCLSLCPAVVDGSARVSAQAATGLCLQAAGITCFFRMGILPGLHCQETRMIRIL